jgi:predicted nucleotide-binding protein
MPYYHVIIALKSRPHKGAIESNLLEQDLVNTIANPYNKGEPFKCGDVVVSQDDISYMRITESEEILSRDTHWLSPRTYFANLWQVISQQRDVTEKFLKTLPHAKKEKVKEIKPLSKDIFIVHGRDLKPVKELKIMLEQFGLKPIVLHEQPSGSITVFEKLWKYSNVGYVFVILTPDDVGYCQSEVEYLFSTQKKKHPVLSDIRPFIKDVFFGEALDNLDEFFTLLNERARQNVVLEFGYFMGFLGQKKVFCLYKGDIDLPSDMRGILHAQFRKSVKEAKEDIVRELKGAHYDLHIQKTE